jgi:flagellum-specific peptidoglycan hydrolase FlgJ
MPHITQDIIAAAQASEKQWKIPASISIAQWAIESGWGSHCPRNNPFGIKAIAGYDTQCLNTTEVIHGIVQHLPQNFCAFTSLNQAFECHAKLIATAPVYAPAMAALPDHGKFITLMAAHYATDPLYAHKIEAVIATSHLVQYDAPTSSPVPSPAPATSPHPAANSHP